MGKIYLYADEESRQALLADNQKIISVGSDFGYGNFGDVVQHINTLNFLKKSKKFSAVSLLSANAIGFRDYPSWARRCYGVDAVIFVADSPLVLDGDAPALRLVSEVKNIAALHMYGGGFLNEMWGDFVLGVVEYFLNLMPGVRYFVSGQQITPPFHFRVLQHIKQFKPELFGVRDDLSQKCLRDAGFEAHFSFDDASEALCEMSERLSLRRGAGALMHLNVSSYTANDEGVGGLGEELKAVLDKVAAKGNLTLLQAYKDPRQEVLDSRESLKILDYRIPFNDFRLIELAPLAYGADFESRSMPVIGDFGYSCSYHVALFLQLAGIPCWLRSSNDFYDQKSNALQVEQSLSEFLREPRLADHRVNLERRALWHGYLERALEETPFVNKVTRIQGGNEESTPVPFLFKGKPTLEERLVLAQKKINYLSEGDDEFEQWYKNIEVNSYDPLRIKVQGFVKQLTALGAESHRQRQSAESALHENDALRAEMVRNAEDSGHRQMALRAEMVRNVENSARREMALRAEIVHCAEKIANQALNVQRIEEVEERARQLDEQLAQILRSRSWALTKPLRAIFRFIEHGYFDSQGQVGIFVLLQKIGRRLPLPASIRVHIGQFLLKMRRKKK